jgi:nicotinamide mononucleotide transporter
VLFPNYEMYTLMSVLQIICTILGIAVVLLNTKEKVLAWPLTVMATVLGLFIYYEKRLYAKCLLNIIYLILGMYGWYQWLYGNRAKKSLRVSTTNLRTMGILGLTGVAFVVTLWRILMGLTHADLVYEDSVHTALCLIAQWMTARKKLESWILWAIADILYTSVCYYKELYWLSGLHIFYILLAVHGYRAWRQVYLRQKAALPANS